MSIKQALSYILRHFWLWPLVFYLRPLETIQRLEKIGTAEDLMEFITALLGGAWWGALLGIALWAMTGNPHAIWVLAVAVAVAIAVAVAFAFAGAIAIAIAIAVAVAGAIAVAIAGAVAIAVVVAGAGAGAGAGAVAFAGAVVGVAIGLGLPEIAANIRFFRF
uniref:Uncharacterized protein n=1 Tax=Candidatus Kentrum sp. TUN TaxID=2126343 RepID=A0A451A2K3_9GAMM|nr:MAG: hypothetical protein BECKTUN1418F_GA0071002_12092 [Candidatus Kentron sp. TUN]